MFIKKTYTLLALACPRLSDSGPRFLNPRGPDYLGAWNRVFSPITVSSVSAQTSFILEQEPMGSWLELYFRPSESTVTAVAPDSEGSVDWISRR